MPGPLAPEEEPPDADVLLLLLEPPAGPPISSLLEPSCRAPVPVPVAMPVKDSSRASRAERVQSMTGDGTGKTNAPCNYNFLIVKLRCLLVVGANLEYILFCFLRTIQVNGQRRNANEQFKGEVT